MYQYRNLPPRHQPPGFYPPHQPSLRHQRNPHQTHDAGFAGSHALTRSHSHGMLHTSSHPHHVTHSTAGYRTHHIPPPDKHKKELNGHSPHGHGPSYVHNGHSPDTALYAIQQMQRIKAATACQIINNRVVEAIRQQQQKKLQEKQLKRKLDPNWKDPNETNPNNPAYKGPENAKLLKLLAKKKKKIKKVVVSEIDEAEIDSESMETIHTPTQGAATAGASEEEEEEEEDADTDEEDTHCESQAIQSMVEAMQDKLDEAYTERMMTIPQLEISTAPKSTANITNLSEEELKMNPQLYKMYSYYIPFAHRGTASSAPPPLNTPTTPPTPPNPHHHRSNMGPRRRNPNFLKPQLVGDEIYPRSHSYSPNKHRNLINTAHGHAHSHSPIRTVGSAKLVPIGNVKPNPLDIEKKGKKHTEPHIAPAHANVQSVISPNGGIYHPCHGYSQRDISIFDLFPGIVKYQSKKYAECDRVDYLVSLSEKSFCSVNNKPLKVNEAEMWYTALKYLFNDITLGQFDYMSVEMRYVIKQYMSTHKNRLSFLKSIKSYGFLRVISDVSKKLPREHIQKIMKQEREKKEKQEREKLVALQKQIRYQQLIQQQQMYQQQLYQQHEATHYADWYTGSKLKRTVSEPPPLTASYKPCIVDEEDDDIDDSWNFITEIVNNNKIPDLPPEREHTHSSSPSTHTSDDDEAKEQEEMNEIVDVYTMLYQTMKDKEGPDVSLADLTTIEQHDTFTPKVN